MTSALGPLVSLALSGLAASALALTMARTTPEARVDEPAPVAVAATVTPEPEPARALVSPPCFELVLVPADLPPLAALGPELGIPGCPIRFMTVGAEDAVFVTAISRALFSVAGPPPDIDVHVLDLRPR